MIKDIRLKGFKKKKGNLKSWGNFPKIESNIIKFNKNKNLKEIIKTNNKIIIYGNGGSYGDSALGSNVIYREKKNKILSFKKKEGLLHVEAGVLLSEILNEFVPKGWFLKVTPGRKYITVGGAIASDVHGKNHHIDGCFSETLKEFQIMLPNGSLVNCSKKLKPELFKATCGGMGLTGVILSAKIFLKKINSTNLETEIVKTKNLKETFEFFEFNKKKTYSYAWINTSAQSNSTGKGLCTTGEFKNDGCLDFKTKKKISLPDFFPDFFINSLTTKLFNFINYNRFIKKYTKRTISIENFFYPLDTIANWNRIYGKNGFIQYHFILPKKNSLNGMKKILKKILKSEHKSFLAVMKLHKKENKNYLSFPLEGFSLAIDFKIKDGLFNFLKELDKIVLKFNGRIYLTKDSRVNEKVFKQGYPKINDFIKFRKNNKMTEKFQSNQSKRLGF